MEGLTVKSVGDFIIWLGAVSGALVGIGIILRLVVVKPLKNMYKKELTSQLESVHDKTDLVLSEVAPVNGLRISERLSRLEIGYDNLDKRITDHTTMHREL